MNQGGVSGNVFLQNTIVNSGNSNHGGVNNVNGLGNIVVNSDVQVGGGGNSLSLESVLADQRSRHNSAESEPPMSMRVSPSCLGPNNLTLGHGGTNSMEINNSR